MAHDIVTFLEQVPLFSEMSGPALARIAGLARWRHLPAGEELIREGERGRDLAVVFSGRVEISRTIDGTPRVIGTAGHLAAIGELSLLTHEPRAATVRALRDTLVLQIAAPDLEQVLLEEPTVCLALARTLAARLTDGRPPPPSAAAPATIAVVALTEELPFAQFVQTLLAELERHGSTAVLRPATPDTRPDSLDERHRAWLEELDQLEQEHGIVVLVAPDPIASPDWAHFCTRSADRVLLLARGGRPPEWAAIDPGCHHRDLVLVSSAPAPARLTALEDALTPRARHIVDPAALDRDVGRVARRVSGHAVGVVFSGGGARGMAHIGALLALEEAGVVIDRVGGCSAGALAAALVASGYGADEILERVRTEFVEHNPFGDVTIPREALTKGRRMRTALERLLGDRVAETLPLPLFAVSADLDRGELVVHRQGALRSIVGASMAIPGLAPPVRFEGQVLVDGGLLDNFPVDIMAEQAEGPILGIDVMRQLPTADADASTEPGGRRDERSSGIVSTLARAMVIGAQQRMGRNRLLADVLVTPEVADIGLLAFDRFDDAVEAGRVATQAVLDTGALRPSGPG